ncbi:MarR family transcriptional regulator [Streptomyces sp. NPDC057509]|uniref:MarR family transcriptional regulator n=1 Tax=Streptomyces sp. NPDC057509 TaxID=3346152 RepID=UPI00369453BE
MAQSGYGKRAVPGQHPARPDDFASLPLRERYIAAFVERLPEGAVMSVKALAKQIPLYGQQAVASAMTALSVAGHLRRVRCALVDGQGQVRWVFRTFWSRTAHDNEWWAEFLGSLTVVAPEVESVVAAPAPAPAPESALSEAPAASAVPAQRVADPEEGGRSTAYLALAELGRVDTRLALSHAHCAALEPLAGQWFARGVDVGYFVRTLTAGLPASVDSPFGFVRRRLGDKLPPVYRPAPERAGGVTHPAKVECVECGVPGPVDALPDGLCRGCREPAGADPQADPQADPSRPRVRDRIAALKDLVKSS